MRFNLTRLGALTAAGALLIALPMCARDSRSSRFNSPSTGPDEASARTALKDTPLGRVVSRDANGKARFILGAARSAPAVIDVDAETAARIHLSRHAGLLGLHEAAVHGAQVTATHRLPGGATAVQFAQSVNGVEVFRSRASVVVDDTRNLVSISSTLHAGAASTHALKAMRFAMPAETALANLYADHFGRALAPGAVRDQGPLSGGDVRNYAVQTDKGAARIGQATAKRVLYPDGDRLTPAYYIELLARAPDTRENEAGAYVLAASDGHVLYQTSLLARDAFQYRVWAESNAGNVPMDGPYADFTPHPTGVPDKIVPPLRPPNAALIAMDGFNKNPGGTADPWLLADKTVTFGNNVHAYTDRNDQHTLDDAGNDIGDGFDRGDIEADVTGPRTFDRVYDTTKAPNATTDQMKAAVTQIFYVTNWLHDYWYDSGFDEPSGVAQVSNYGRGGVEGDPLRAEGQDGADFGQSNNANMATFAEGTSPRMQMFVWTGVPNRTLTTTPALSFVDGYGAAVFGPQVFSISGGVVLSTYNGASPPNVASDACQAPANVAGKIAIVDRGVCSFVTKAKNAQTAGATGVILVNNVEGHFAPSPGAGDPTVTIPLLGLSLEDGQILKNAVAAGAVSAQLARGSEVLHDGTIDNTVVAHEWGHYLHHRLVVCGSQSCGGMSEGWADFDALMMVLREGDPLEGPAYPLAQYAAAGLLSDAAYFGIRRAPYSTDMAKNPFTFKYVSAAAPLPEGAPLAPTSPNMNEVHNVGEIWAQAMFDGYVNLQKVGKAAGRSFQETKRRMANYIVAGMKATPVEPTFIEQRDAILSAPLAAKQLDDFKALAQGFAKRGFGVGAVAPPTSSFEFTEVAESMASGGDLGFVEATTDDSVSSCDRDGVLDAGESGLLKITLRNTGFSALSGAPTKVSATSTDSTLTFGADLGGASITSIDVFGEVTATVPIQAGKGPIARGDIPLTITLSNADAVTKSGTTTVRLGYNYDDVPNVSMSDGAESAKEPWTFASEPAKLAPWSRTPEVSEHVLSSNHVWHADDLGTTSDGSLVSPDLNVGTGDLLLTFEHRFEFENGPFDASGDTAYFDGGVLEITSDGGKTWEDISKYADPGYTQTLFTYQGGANVLAGRKAWGGQSDGYPNYGVVSLDLGKAFSGKTIRIRFRVGTDESGGDIGWDIDNLTVDGLTNLPFPSVVDNRGLCVTATDAGAPDASTFGGAPDPGRFGSGDAGGSDNSGGGSGPSGPSGSGDAGSGCAVTRGAGRATPAWLGLAAGISMLLRRRRRTPGG